jgi:BlaI family penicillinase repressor
VPRPKHPQPTPGELEVLKILWERGPSTVRQVMQAMSGTRPRAYTSVMSLLGVMTDKGLVIREPKGRAFLYRAKAVREKTLGKMVEDLLNRAFEGSVSALVARLLDQSSPSPEELEEIRKALEEYRRQQGEK